MTSVASRPAALDRGLIVATALDLLDEVGLDGLSTRKLAVKLGVSGPSLYWHFRGMGELRDHMAEALLEGALPSNDAPGEWQDWMADGARAIRRAALSRRDGARLMATARPTAERTALRYPVNLGRLEAAGFSPLAAKHTFMALARYAWGAALAEQAIGGDPTKGLEAFEFGLGALIRGLEAELSSVGPSA